MSPVLRLLLLVVALLGAGWVTAQAQAMPHCHQASHIQYHEAKGADHHPQAPCSQASCCAACVAIALPLSQAQPSPPPAVPQWRAMAEGPSPLGRSIAPERPPPRLTA